MRDDFAAFVLSYKRPNNVTTIDALKYAGYTGKIYVIVGNDDPTLEEYKKNFPNNLYIFDKEKAIKESGVDPMDNFGRKNCVLWVRTQCFRIAKELGLKYFVELDDDYNIFRYILLKRKTKNTKHVRNLDDVFEAYLEVFNFNPHIKCLAFAQGGDFIGGVGSALYKKEIKQKVMNSFINCVDRPWDLCGTMNEDATAYTLNATRGDLYLTFADVALEQGSTQKHAGGLTDMYLASGTYVKTFYSVMACPAGVKCWTMGPTNARVHHKIIWPNVCPKVISDKYKKK